LLHRFAGGFALGTFPGISIERKLALGTAIVRIITNRPTQSLIDHLRAAKFGVTSIDGRGAAGPIQIFMTAVKRRQLEEVFDLIETHQPGAFYAVDDLQAASEGIFPHRKPSLMSVMPSAIKFLRSF
jgi:uncharacterized protein YebE (UPF0316 family)